MNTPLLDKNKCNHKWVFIRRVNEGRYSSDPYYVNYFMCPECGAEREIGE